ncbi:MAG: hypothetical protein ACUVX1_17410, partial [Chloroflexota bacterium]
SQIQSITAGQITGLIASSQIESLAADKITGLIAASQIGSVNASAITGLIVASQIQSITAGQITGLIASSQIQSLAADKITGLIVASQIGSVNASAITGLIQANQIQAINATQITGSISYSQIGSVNAQTITVNTLVDSQISSVSVSKLLAGSADFYGNVFFNAGTSYGVYIYSGMNLYVNPGTLYATQAQFKSSGYGWEITVGTAPEIRNAGAYGKVRAGYLVAELQAWLPFVADNTLDWAPIGKVACYDTSGTFRGWIPVME